MRSNDIIPNTDLTRVAAKFVLISLGGKGSFPPVPTPLFRVERGSEVGNFTHCTFAGEPAGQHTEAVIAHAISASCGMSG